jgi:hypothetical protein
VDSDGKLLAALPSVGEWRANLHALGETPMWMDPCGCATKSMEAT